MNTKDKIFNAAIDLFCDKGFHGTSMRDLAQAVGIKESSLYNHFSRKEALLEAILDFQIQGFQRASPPGPEVDGNLPPGISLEDAWIYGMMEFIKKLPPQTGKIARIITNEMHLNVPCRQFVLTRLYQAQRGLTETLLNQFHHLGMVKPGDFRTLAAQYVYMIQGLEIENRLRAQEGEDLETGLQRMIHHIQFFLKSLKP